MLSLLAILTETKKIEMDETFYFIMYIFIVELRKEKEPT